MSQIQINSTCNLVNCRGTEAREALPWSLSWVLVLVLPPLGSSLLLPPLDQTAGRSQASWKRQSRQQGIAKPADMGPQLKTTHPRARLQNYGFWGVIISPSILTL